MKIKILKAFIESDEGKTIVKPNEKIIDMLEIETYRSELKKTEHDGVLFTYEEIG